MRTRHVAIAALVATAVALGVWAAVLRPGADSTWIVSATISDPAVADAACGDINGITDRSFSMTSDLAPGQPAGGVEWTVKGRRAAEAVRACLVEHGATSPRVEADKAKTSFGPAGP